MEAEKLNIIESNITDIDSIVEVCINSICYEPDNVPPVTYLYFFETIQKKLKEIRDQF